ncbi:MAG: acyl-CoA dehydrogenase family protein [Steroidobacteraceae bacterium]
MGPAELLNHYGTQAQKDHYLPRLARGDEIPCFALTGPRAGSDAASLPDTGIVGRGLWQGQEVLGLTLNFSKRYITLAPVATVIGLAFRMFDPQKLLGERTDLGITVALIPRETPGISIGRRHFPLNIPLPERTGAGTGCVRAAGLYRRRTCDGRPGLAHAGRAAVGGALHLPALQCHRQRQGGRPGHRRVRTRAAAVQSAHRALRGHRGRDRAHDGSHPTSWMPPAP